MWLFGRPRLLRCLGRPSAGRRQVPITGYEFIPWGTKSLGAITITVT
jgi:hypothetical protein